MMTTTDLLIALSNSVLAVLLMYDIAFPKSVTWSRDPNSALLDFRLTGDEMTAISRLDRGQHTGVYPDDQHTFRQAA